jgi:PAS domain S-box-containing protein
MSAEHISTILIVDDDRAGRKMLEGLLRSPDYQIIFAASGQEALDQARANMPDLLLLDVMMAGMDGFEVCRRLRDDALLADVPIIMVTALDDQESRIHGLESGADDFVTKPVDRTELRARVRTVTRLNRYRRLLSERTQRQQAEEQTRQRSRDLALLNRVIATAASTLDVEETLHTACKALAYAFDLPQATATLLSAQQTQCTIVAEYPFIARLHDGQQRLEASEASGWLSAIGSIIPVASIPTLARVLEQRTPLVIPDAQHDPQLASVHAILRERGIASLMSVPILVRDEVAGTIELSATARREFSEQDIALAESVAAATGHAIETAHLHQQLRQHAAQLEDLVAQRTLELQTERDQTRSILEAVGEAVVVATLDGAIQYLNPAAVVLTGYSVEEALGQSWSIWQSDRQSPLVYLQIQAAVRDGRVWQGEVINRRKDGTLYATALTAAPLFHPDDPARATGCVIVQRDISILKEAERLKDQFVSNVSHELRTPLSVITLLSGNLDTLYDRLDDRQRRTITRDIRTQTRVLNDLISSVLEISRIDSASIPAEHQRVDLGQLALEELEKQLPLSQRKSQVAEVVRPAELPVYGNEGQLRQVIRNLINNAIKYTPEGGRITCLCSLVEQPSAEREPARKAGAALEEWPGRSELPAGRWAAVRVTDSGGGIAEHDLSRIFERFYRVKTQGNIPGTGLGLSIARELVALNNGQVAVASALNSGSRFVIYIPLLEDSAHDHDSRR